MSIVIIGGGGAGLAAADMLRREGYDGPITMIDRGRCPAERSAELVEGLSGWYGTGRNDICPRYCPSTSSGGASN